MIPLSLEIKNFYSHKYSYIDFTKFDSALILGNVEGNYDLSNGSGKCLGKDTLLTHALTGEVITVKNLHLSQRNDFYVYGLDEDFKLRPTKVIATQYSGEKPLLKIILSNGIQEIVSETHPIFTDSLKTVEARLLKVGDYVAQPRFLNSSISYSASNYDKLTIEKARILGLYLAEGNLTHKSLSFTNTDEEIINLGRAKYLSKHNLSRLKTQHYSNFTENKTFKNLAFSDVIWVKIKNIEKLPVDETYDIQVSNSTSLYALNGFITHNSAIFQGILWCLFNKSRSASMDDIILWGENYCQVILIFKQNDDIYKISRKRSRVNSTTYIDFSKQDENGTWVDISGSTSSLTNAEVEKVIKSDYKTFVNSVYFAQNDISEFAEADASRKKEILKSIIDLSKWDLYEDAIKAKIKEMKIDGKILASKLDGLEQVDVDCKLTYKALEQVKITLSQNNQKKIDLEQLIQLTSQKYYELKKEVNTNLWDQTIESLKKLEEESKVIERKLNSTNLLIKENKTTYEKKEVEKNNLKIQIENLITDDQVLEKIAKINEELIEHKSKFTSASELLATLKERKIVHEQCYVCQQAITEELYSKLKLDLADEISKYQDVQIYSQNKTHELKFKKQDLEKIKENNILKEKNVVKIKALEVELSALTIKKQELELDFLEFKQKQEHNQSNIIVNNNILESIKNDDFKSLQKKLSELKLEYQNIVNETEQFNRQFGILTEKISNLEKKIAEAIQYKESYSKNQKEIAFYEKAVKFLGKNGIQVILLNEIIEDLEKTANEILISICNEPFNIFLDTQRTGSDGISKVDTLDLRVKKEGIVQNFKSLSGGEQFRVSLALRIALSEMASQYGGASLEFLLLDEINSPLDRHGTESLFVNIIKKLETKYKILIITHNDYLKEKFEHILDVTKINGESSVVYLNV